MIGKILLVISWIYIVFGIIGIFRFENMYSRLLTSSKIDTVATLTLLIALVFYTGISEYTVKLLLIIFFLVVTSPISSHIIVRSAYFNGISVNQKEEKPWKLW
jgi:multicomponent Na+:H+ antiporter subunit G